MKRIWSNVAVFAALMVILLGMAYGVCTMCRDSAQPVRTDSQKCVSLGGHTVAVLDRGITFYACVAADNVTQIDVGN